MRYVDTNDVMGQDEVVWEVIKQNKNISDFKKKKLKNKKRITYDFC